MFHTQDGKAIALMWVDGELTHTKLVGGRYNLKISESDSQKSYSFIY